MISGRKSASFVPCHPDRNPRRACLRGAAAVSMLGSQAAPRRRNRTEQLLVGLIVALTLWGIVMQVMVRSYVRQERSLTDGDEERLAEQHGQSATFPSHRLQPRPPRTHSFGPWLLHASQPPDPSGSSGCGRQHCHSRRFHCL